MKKINIFTVVTHSYLPLARVLYQSIQKYNSDFKFSIILTDVSTNLLNQIRKDLEPEIEYISCDDLPFENIAQMRERYSILEFNSACKVLGLSYFLFNKNLSECLFLDPDLYFFGNLEHFFSKIKKDIYITNHASAPFPEDNEHPTDLELFYSGHINGGIVYFNKTIQSSKALHWLVSKTNDQWFVAPEKGMYADQQWLSALPYYFREITQVNDDPGINVAYWNLHERPLTKKNGVLCAKNAPVFIFHFSGFEESNSKVLSIHCTRVFELETQSLLGEIISEYQDLLRIQKKKLIPITPDRTFSNRPLNDKSEVFYTKIIRRLSKIFIKS